MLSPEQIEARKGKITASRISVLMNGVPEDILRLYRILIGEEQEEDLSRSWPVQLGMATEEVNLRFYGFKQGQEGMVTRQGEVVVHPQYPWAACTIDAWDEILKCPIEAKCVGGREPLEVIIDRYQPQLQFQMECTGATQCALSVIVAGNLPVIEYIERDVEYAAEMIRRGKRFMTCVAARLPPVTLPTVPPPVPIDKMREVDMSADEVWCKSAGVWLQSYQAAKSAKDAEAVLKNKLEDDVRKAWGAGVRVTRDKAGRLSLREDKK